MAIRADGPPHRGAHHRLRRVHEPRPRRGGGGFSQAQDKEEPRQDPPQGRQHHALTNRQVMRRGVTSQGILTGVQTSASYW
eukprot:scaffold111683_cov46-Prasinocladus_malaysianus.AAC.1